MVKGRINEPSERCDTLPHCPAITTIHGGASKATNYPALLKSVTKGFDSEKDSIDLPRFLMGLRMEDLHSPTVPSGRTSGSTSNDDRPDRSIYELMAEKKAVEELLSNLSGVLDSVGYLALIFSWRVY